MVAGDAVAANWLARTSRRLRGSSQNLPRHFFRHLVGSHGLRGSTREDLAQCQRNTLNTRHDVSVGTLAQILACHADDPARVDDEIGENNESFKLSDIELIVCKQGKKIHNTFCESISKYAKMEIMNFQK